RTALSELLGEDARVVFAPDRPAERELRVREARKRAPEMGIDAETQARARRRVQTLTRREQPGPLGLPPRFDVVRRHAASRDLISRLPDRARLPQTGEVGRSQPGLDQDGIGMLAETGRRRPDSARRPVEANRRVERAETPGAWMLLLDEQPARGD